MPVTAVAAWSLGLAGVGTLARVLPHPPGATAPGPDPAPQTLNPNEHATQNPREEENR